MVCPDEANTLIKLTTDSAIDESRPVVGSSQNSSGGLSSNSLANERRFASPPEMPFLMPLTPILEF